MRFVIPGEGAEGNRPGMNDLQSQPERPMRRAWALVARFAGQTSRFLLDKMETYPHIVFCLFVNAATSEGADGWGIRRHAEALDGVVP